ncbi:MAG: mannose-phosphate guanylyltransferase [Solirubrobacteraceae bacterium]|nr:mannose-phosphate guanylyltransferase [Solirubrobacteraceae bacterium]
MQAVILVGGEGTRLRPLTSTVPKPVVPLVDRPFIAYMLEWLRTHGVDDVVMSCGFLAAGVHNVLGDGSAYGIRLRYVEEPEPLGTGGAVKFAESLLDERFLMLNGDILTDLDLSAQIAQHEARGARGTLALIPVEDPSAYGLVRTEPDGAVREFLEKPGPDQIDTNLISAGAYVLEREVLSLIDPDRPVSIEREIFPRLVGDGLYAYAGEGYWLDIGTPERYLQGTRDIVEGRVHTEVVERIAPSARVADDATIGPLAVLGPDVVVGPGSEVDRAVVLRGSQIGAGSRVCDSIVAAGVRIGDRTRIEEGAVLGEGVTIGADNVLRAGARIFPGVSLPDGAISF